MIIVNSPVGAETWNRYDVSINGKPIEVVEERTHLRIKRDSVSKSGHSSTVEDIIVSVRGCAYS